MNDTNAFLKQGKNLILVVDNKSHTVNDQHPFYDEIVEALKNDDWFLVADLVEVKKAMATFSDGQVTVEDDEITWNGKPLVNTLTERILSMMREGFSINPMVLFLQNLMQNPSKRAVDELYLFMEAGNLPITPDGYLLAFKKVRSDYKDIHSGTFDNSVGQILEMPRNEVDDNREIECSQGLHFCSQSYLPQFGSSPGNRVMILKIHPADVVSIPKDYNNSKGRTCRYEVIGELENNPDSIKTAFQKSVQGNAYNSYGNESAYDEWGQTGEWGDAV